MHNYMLPGLAMGPANRDVYLNEHGQISIARDIQVYSYKIGAFYMSIDPHVSRCVRLQYWRIGELLPSKIKRWSSSLTSQKDDLCSAYDAIKHIIHRVSYSLFWPEEYQSYAPGSVLTSHGRNLVGRVPIRLEEWEVKWYGSDNDTTILSFPSTHNGSISIPLPYIGTESYTAVIRLRSSDEMLHSWIAQASQLLSCIPSGSLIEDDKLCLLSTEFALHVLPERDYDPFCLCNTFMAEDHHMLWLSISAPSVDCQTNKVSWPVFTWYHADSEMSSTEVKEFFGIKLSRFINDLGMAHMSKTLLTTMPELNTYYGFDPAYGSADICEYFGWSFMEILNVSTGDWESIHGTIPGSVSVISDVRYQALGKKTILSPMDNASEGEQTSEASTETEITFAVQRRDLKLSYVSWVYIVMFTVISFILLSFIVQTYL
ncbi:hypothetical protein ARMGADRAFT_1158260 [Armillaria gallica]|uniref:Uncharacterized protein n=1 Tax=Armillaria gallica TaxID=47427 RepID=A0A2H3EAL1_ARMGA|nr:hypothetical protein ARMGADRAFT_1158260 [Armillaria gallica]